MSLNGGVFAPVVNSESLGVSICQGVILDRKEGGLFEKGSSERSISRDSEEFGILLVNGHLSK